MAKKNYSELAQGIVANVGNKENVSDCFHCATRLRLHVKDESLVNAKEIEKLNVVGTNFVGEQLQIIIGADVADVYKAVCKLLGMEEKSAINEMLDSDLRKEKLTPKRVLGKVMGYISGSLPGLMPALIGAGMCKTIAVLLGPDMLNVIAATSDLYIFMTMIYNAIMYFLPIELGYCACKALNMEPIYGIFFGAILICPDFLAMVGGEPFSIYGIPVTAANYSQSFLPILLTCPIIKVVHKTTKKYSPTVVSSITVPLVTILVVAPVMFCVCAPLGGWIGNLLGGVIQFFATGSAAIRIVGTTLMAILWPFMIMGGMHGAVIPIAIASFMELGFDSFIMTSSAAYQFAVVGMALGAFLKIKDKERKGETLSYFITGFVAGLSEPTMYGVCLRYKRAVLAMVVACGIGGLISGILNVKIFMIGGMYNIFSIMAKFIGGGTANLVAGMVMVAISFFCGVAAAYFVVDYSKTAAE